MDVVAGEASKQSLCFVSAAAAQFLGADDLREDRGAHDGLRAEPQVHQHLPYEDTGDVDRDNAGHIEAR